MSEPYHMIGYIHENPGAVRRTLDDNEARIERIAVRMTKDQIQRVIIFGTGSSYAAAVMATPLFRYHCAFPVHVLSASELMHYAARLVDKHTLAVGVSRSGERGQVIDTINDCAARGAFCVGMTGVRDSLLAQSAELTLLTSEGPEITFPKTKSVTASAGLLMRLALALGTQDDEAAARLAALQTMPDVLQRTLAAAEDQLAGLLPAITAHRSVVVAGTGANYGAALEAAIKIPESAYVPAHCDDTGNLLHSPLGVLDQDWLAILLVTQRDLDLSKLALNLVGQFKARRLSIMEPGLDLQGLSDDVLTLPVRVDPLLAALAYLVPMQLIAYHWAVARGLNPDAPASMHATLATVLAPGRQEPELRH